MPIPDEAIGARLSGRPRPGRPISLGYLPSVEHGLDSADEHFAARARARARGGEQGILWPPAAPRGGFEKETRGASMIAHTFSCLFLAFQHAQQVN